MILILIGRIVEGMGVGCSSFSCPLYASEIAPTNLRGMLSGFMQMIIVVGLFTANVVNFFFKDHKLEWRLSNRVILISPIIIMIGIFFCPETPRWLFKKKDRQSAEKSLKYIWYVQISKKGNYGNFHNFQKHVNSMKSIFEKF
jgi:MFS family permease